MAFARVAGDQKGSGGAAEPRPDGIPNVERRFVNGLATEERPG
jgi:hypothetical protein